MALLLVYYILLTRVTTPERLASAAGQNPPFLAGLAALVVLTITLFGANVAIFALLTRARLRGSSPSAGSIVGGIVGAFAAGCPACGAYLLSLVGIGGALAALPFGGLEVWALSSLIMAATLSASVNRLQRACMDEDGSCESLPPISSRHTAIGLTTTVGIALALLWSVAVVG